MTALVRIVRQIPAKIIDPLAEKGWVPLVEGGIFKKEIPNNLS